jgi:serine/threonine protein kinase/predicted DsbA family dithiol-disulfide isomerase
MHPTEVGLLSLRNRRRAQGTLVSTSVTEPPEPVRPGALSMLLADLARAPEGGMSGWDALSPGAVIGRFELVRELGRGGFGVVWEARDRMLGRAVAFKAVPPGRRAEAREELLLREAEAAARLAHPNIVTLFDVGRTEQGPFLVLELLRGETLASQIARGPLSVPEAVRIAIDVSKGLAHAHAHGVVHRDLTPGNVFLCQDGQVKVLDLGMAHAFGRPKVEGGTPAFMAPEQRRGAPEDERTDVFALGLVMHRMLLGKRSSAGGKEGQAPPPLETPALPELGALIARMLTDDPVGRPRNAGEVLAELSTLQRALERAPAGSVAVRLRRRPPRRIAALAGVAVALAALAAWQALRNGGGPSASGRASSPNAPVVDSPQPSTTSERWSVPVDASARIRGPADAPVTIVEFGDFACPYTRKAEAVLRRLAERFPDKIRLVWKDYPLNAHPDADAAAQLALEAMREKGAGGFWKAHDALLAMPSHLSPPALEKLGAELGLDRAELGRALGTGRHRAAIDGDVQTLARLGPGGTPTFFVNGIWVDDPAALEQTFATALSSAEQLLGKGVPPARIYLELQRGARTAGDAPRRVTLPPPGQRPTRGGTSPRAVVVNEFCDLTLPRCAWFERPFREALMGYGEKVRLVWWDVSDPQRPEARLVARAARAAASASPGGFWAMHDAILGDQEREGLSPGPQRFTLGRLREDVRRAGVDVDVFDYEMASDDGRPLQDVEEARALGLGAGTLVIDGELLGGASPAWVLRDAIERALARRPP